MINHEQFKKAQEFALAFLAIADKNREAVNRYFDYSDAREDVKAYEEVIEAEAAFLKVYNEMYDDKVKPALNYEIAASIAYAE